MQVRTFVLGSPLYSDIWVPVFADDHVQLVGGGCGNRARMHGFGPDGRLAPTAVASSGDVRLGRRS